MKLIVDRTDDVSSSCFEVVAQNMFLAQNTVLRLWMELTKSAQNTVLRLWMKLIVDRTDDVSSRDKTDDVSSKHVF
ncbi:Uncharacterised protein [Streptococcus pneumoniae]|nr:Uncharacterised protein [Streptococcus pneumoniae]